MSYKLCSECKHSHWHHNPNDYYLPTLSACLKDQQPMENCPEKSLVNGGVRQLVRDIQKKKVERTI